MNIYIKKKSIIIIFFIIIVISGTFYISRMKSIEKKGNIIFENKICSNNGYHHKGAHNDDVIQYHNDDVIQYNCRICDKNIGQGCSCCERILCKKCSQITHRCVECGGKLK